MQNEQVSDDIQELICWIYTPNTGIFKKYGVNPMFN